MDSFRVRSVLGLTVVAVAVVHLGGHLRVQLEQLFEPLGVVFKAAANVDAL